MMHLVVVDKDNDNCVSRDFLNGVQVAQRIDLIEASISPHTWTRPSVPDITAHAL